MIWIDSTECKALLSIHAILYPCFIFKNTMIFVVMLDLNSYLFYLLFQFSFYHDGLFFWILLLKKNEGPIWKLFNINCFVFITLFCQESGYLGNKSPVGDTIWSTKTIWPSLVSFIYSSLLFLPLFGFLFFFAFECIHAAHNGILQWNNFFPIVTCSSISCMKLNTMWLKSRWSCNISCDVFSSFVATYFCSVYLNPAFIFFQRLV